MKSIFIMIFILLAPAIVVAYEDDQQLRKKSDWYTHFDRRLNELEARFITDMETMQQSQSVLTKEMHHLNERLENRFDKYFLWGYGTLLVVISTLVSVIFNKRRNEHREEEQNTFE